MKPSEWVDARCSQMMEDSSGKKPVPPQICCIAILDLLDKMFGDLSEQDGSIAPTEGKD